MARRRGFFARTLRDAKRLGKRQGKALTRLGKRQGKALTRLGKRQGKALTRLGKRQGKALDRRITRLGRRVSKALSAPKARAPRKPSLRRPTLTGGLSGSGIQILPPKPVTTGGRTTKAGPQAVVRVRGDYEKTMLALARLDPHWEVTIGVHGREGAAVHKGGANYEDLTGPAQTIADIASEHELGLGVPERSFIRAYVDANAVAIARDLRAAAAQIIAGRLTNTQAANLIGMKHAAGVQKWISDGKVVPPLSPITIQKKGSSTPLIDTGQLRAAITWLVGRLLP